MSVTKTSGNRSKSHGWAAFDLKQRQKQGFEPEQVNEDPYPPISTALATLHTCSSSKKHNNVSTRSFSSVLVPSIEFPALTRSKDCHRQSQVGHPSQKHGNNIVLENSHDLIFKKLEEFHSWADSSLIEDVMTAVSNDVDKALRLLEAMVSSESTEDDMGTNSAKQTSNFGDFWLDQKLDKSVLLGQQTGIDDLRSALEDRLRFNYNQLEDVYASCGKVGSDGTSNSTLILERLNSIPVEADWEEDNVYLIHRKDAIRMMRSASQHSRAATNAFIRGDHVSAQKHSLKAQEEWLVAEKLNAKAAKEILSARNSKNDMWILDLHGLHATEAVQALQERLHRIESQASKNRSVSPNRVQTMNRILCSSSQESLISMDTEKSDKQQASFRQRATSLQVITGVGNHSRGEAALPTAVRSFLNENRYWFDEPRPGVITVRPKFRHR